MPNKPIKSNQRPIENSLTGISFLLGFIPSVLLLVCLWLLELSPYFIALTAVVLIFFLAYSVLIIRQKLQHQFRNLHNLLDAVARGDYSFRASTLATEGVYGDITASINSLAQTLQKQRLLSEESQLLVRKVVDQIDVAIVAWNQKNQVQLINPAASRLIGLDKVEQNQWDNTVVMDLPDALGFANTMDAGETRVEDLHFSDHRGKFRLHLEKFISEGDAHKLLFLTNVSNILRLEEKKAWQNLVRVLSHEINNSLTPLKSLSETLKRQVLKREQDEALKQEIIDAMTIVSSRADGLVDFVRSYQKIARLPEPNKTPIALRHFVSRLPKLFPEQTINIEGEETTVPLDANQFEQVLINLLKNAVEAGSSSKQQEPAPPITVSWTTGHARIQIKIADCGAGIQNTENLFTPFYTTKTSGSGIGLVFCKQVIEAHEGFLTIKNREPGPGCEAIIDLPCTQLHTEN